LIKIRVFSWAKSNPVEIAARLKDNQAAENLARLKSYPV